MCRALLLLLPSPQVRGYARLVVVLITCCCARLVREYNVDARVEPLQGYRINPGHAERAHDEGALEA